MKVLLFLSFILISFNYKLESNIKHTSNCYIVLETKYNKVMEGNNYYRTQSVASISKIMTGILAIEHLDLDKKVYIDNCIDKAYGSAVYLKKYTWITNKDLIYGLLLRSGNDCALMLAKSVSGSLSCFVELMNQKALALGMKRTRFANPHGLDEMDGGNISCCYDMALLQSYALNNNVYKEITSSIKYKSEHYGVWINKNKLLKIYDKCISGKTGYTRKAKRTLVTSAQKEDLTFVIVTLNCGNDFNFHHYKYKELFSLYEYKIVLEKGLYDIDNVFIEIEKDIRLLNKKTTENQILFHIIIDEKNKKYKIYNITKNDKEFICEGCVFEKKEKDFVSTFFDCFIKILLY